MKIIYIMMYRLMEKIDGEKGKKMLSYRIAERIKQFALCRLGSKHNMKD